jgi:MoaA/NifB/PqqE/SkfB family radical SAM enzyme
MGIMENGKRKSMATTRLPVFWKLSTSCGRWGLGGEAMLRKDIGEILNYCKLKGFYVSFNTNGFQVPQRINEIACVDTFVVSLDGKEENNDRHRGKGSFKVATEAIKVAADYGIPTIISATLTRTNISDMEYLADFAKVQNLRVQYSILYNSEEERVDSFSMSDEETREVTKKF